MSALPHCNLTPDEYLANERQAEFKSEYYDGLAYVLAGASEKHNTIAGNCFAELHAKLKSRDCKIYINDMKVRAPNSHKFFYPDVLVVCGPPQFHDNRQGTVLNPLLVIEVLSDSAAAYDNSKKFWSYQQIESLQEYVLVAQDDFTVESYRRAANGDWVYHHLSGLGNSLALASLSCEIPLADIYDKVILEMPEK